MLRSISNPFGDVSHALRIAESKAALRSPNAPLAERAAGLLLLGAESDSESKLLVLEAAAAGDAHPWLQQSAGEALAQMLQARVVAIEDLLRLTEIAAETAIPLLSAECDSSSDGLITHIKNLRPRPRSAMERRDADA